MYSSLVSACDDVRWPYEFLCALPSPEHPPVDDSAQRHGDAAHDRAQDLGPRLSPCDDRGGQGSSRVNGLPGSGSVFSARAALGCLEW